MLAKETQQLACLVDRLSDDIDHVGQQYMDLDRVFATRQQHQTTMSDTPEADTKLPGGPLDCPHFDTAGRRRSEVSTRLSIPPRGVTAFG